MNKLAFMGMKIASMFADYHYKKFKKWKALFEKFYEKKVRK